MAHFVADLSRDQEFDRMCVATSLFGFTDKVITVPSSAYHDEQEKALRFIRESTELSNEEKKRFFKSATANLGTSALCLSGGASFGYCASIDSCEYSLVTLLKCRPYRSSESIPGCWFVTSGDCRDLCGWSCCRSRRHSNKRRIESPLGS